MIAFDPTTLESELRSAVKQLIDVLPECDCFNLLNDDSNTEDCDDQVVTPETMLDLCFNRTESDFSLSVAEFLRWAEGHRTGKLVAGYEARFGDETYFRVGPVNAAAFAFSEAMSDNLDRSTILSHGPPLLCGVNEDRKKNLLALRGSVRVEIPVNGEMFICRLQTGPTKSGVVALRDLRFIEDYYPIHDEDLSIVVSHPIKTTDQSLIHAVAEAFLFELSSSHGVVLNFETYPVEDDHLNFNGEVHDNVGRFENGGALRIRPITPLVEIPDLLALFRRANIVDDDEFAILNYVRTIEYVSATIEKRTIHNTIRKKLLATEALAPSAEFIDGLITAVDENNKGFKKDADAIRRAIEECCVPELLGAYAPPFLKDIRRLNTQSSAEMHQTALRKVAEALVATRNEIAHAKPTYKRTGAECPEIEMPQFRKLAGKIAEQTIRYFAEIPHHQRVTNAS